MKDDFLEKPAKEQVEIQNKIGKEIHKGFVEGFTKELKGFKPRTRKSGSKRKRRWDRC